jgi:hypothetical protein
VNGARKLAIVSAVQSLDSPNSLRRLPAKVVSIGMHIIAILEIGNAPRNAKERSSKSAKRTTAQLPEIRMILNVLIHYLS